MGRYMSKWKCLRSPKRVWDLRVWSYIGLWLASCGCLELNLGLLQDQFGLLTTMPSIQAPKYFINSELTTWLIFSIMYWINILVFRNKKNIRNWFVFSWKSSAHLMVTILLSILYILNKYILEYKLFLFCFVYFSFPIPTTTFPSQLYIFLLNTQSLLSDAYV